MDMRWGRGVPQFGPTDLIGQAAEVGHAQDDARNTRGYMAPPARHQPPRARRCNQLNLNGRKDSGPAIANTNPTMVVDFGESHSSLGSEYIAHRAGAQPNLHLKGETPVILYDDAYYFWHPATSTFLRSSRECHVVGSPTAAEHWELRHSLTKDGPDGYYTFWGQELQGKRKMVLDLFGTSVSSGTRIGTWQKLEGDHQKWVLRSDGDEDGARGLTISPLHGPELAISMEKVDGKVEGFLRPRTGGKDQMFIPLRVQKQ